MTKPTPLSIKAERYTKLESKPAWRAIKLVAIISIILVSLLSTAGLWSEINDCYTQEYAHKTWSPSQNNNPDWWRWAQPASCDTETATQTGGIVTALIPIVGILTYKLFRYTAAYVAYGSEKNKKN